MQYRFKNKGIFSINAVNQLIESRNDDSNTIDMWNYEYDLFQSGFDYHTFDYNDFISNINLITDNATIIKTNNTKTALLTENDNALSLSNPFKIK